MCKRLSIIQNVYALYCWFFYFYLWFVLYFKKTTEMARKGRRNPGKQEKQVRPWFSTSKQVTVSWTKVCVPIKTIKITFNHYKNFKIVFFLNIYTFSNRTQPTCTAKPDMAVSSVRPREASWAFTAHRGYSSSSWSTDVKVTRTPSTFIKTTN